MAVFTVMNISPTENSRRKLENHRKVVLFLLENLDNLWYIVGVSLNKFSEEKTLAKLKTGVPIKCDCGRVVAYIKDGKIYVRCKSCKREVEVKDQSKVKGC